MSDSERSLEKKVAVKGRYKKKVRLKVAHKKILLKVFHADFRKSLKRLNGNFFFTPTVYVQLQTHINNYGLD